jgi:hypothetical protein
LRELKAGDAVHMESVLNNTPWPAELVATSALTLLTMDAAQFCKLVTPWRNEMLAIAASELQPSSNAHLPINFKHLDFMRTIGIGMFGQVRMVVHRFTGVVYAMKCMSKSLLVQHGQQQHVVYPNRHWNDTDGKRIEAHAAGMLQSPTDSRWYWFGESKKLDDSHDPHKYETQGVNCYSAPSVTGPWKNEGQVLTLIDIVVPGAKVIINNRSF